MTPREIAVIQAIEAVGEIEPIEYGEIGDILDPPQPYSSKFGDNPQLIQDNLPGIDVSVHFLEPIEEGEDDDISGSDNRVISQDAIDMTPKVRLPERKEKNEIARKQNIINAFSSVEFSDDIATHIVNLQNAFDIHREKQREEARQFSRVPVNEAHPVASQPQPLRRYAATQPSGFSAEKAKTLFPDTSSQDYEQYHKYSALGILSDYEPTNSTDGEQFASFINRMEDKFETSAASSSIFDDITTETSL